MCGDPFSLVLFTLLPALFTRLPIMVLLRSIVSLWLTLLIAWLATMFSSILKLSCYTDELLYGAGAGHIPKGAEPKSTNPDRDAHTDDVLTSTTNLSDADETTSSESLTLEQDLYGFDIDLLRQWYSTPDT